MFNPSMQQATLTAIPPDVHGKISKATASLDGLSVTRVTFGVGARWSTDLKHDAGTESCELPHIAYVVSGTLHVRMNDGSERDSRRPTSSTTTTAPDVFNQCGL